MRTLRLAPPLLDGLDEEALLDLADGIIAELDLLQGDPDLEEGGDLEAIDERESDHHCIGW